MLRGVVRDIVANEWQLRLVRQATASAVTAFLCIAAGDVNPAFAGEEKKPLRAKSQPLASSAYDWSGLYLGGHLAYGRGRTDNTFSDPAPQRGGSRFGSLFGGLQAGYNYVLPSGWLLGVEADASFPNFLEDGLVAAYSTARGTNVTDQFDYLATIRGRVGYTFDRLMIFGTGGIAWSQTSVVETPGVVNDQDKVMARRTGWSAGGGFEYALAPDWSVKVDYLYNKFRTASGTLPSGARFESRVDLQAVRLGLNYKIGAGDTNGAPAKASDKWLIAPDAWNVHGQLTVVGQGYPSFRSPYQGANSLSGAAQFKSTTSATAFLGLRPWEDTEIYINPELMQGFGLSDTFGAAGYPNGEAQKSGFPVPRVNIARFFIRKTFGFGGEQETFEDGPNQLAGKQDISRLTVTAGKVSVIDYFDNNAYAHDPRRDFLNWNMYCCGSYDLTMDKLAYTWGALAELNQKAWAFRAGYFLVPIASNDNRYDGRVPDRGEYIAELELRYALLSQPGKLRLLGWLNRANAGSYAEAVALPLGSPNYPDIAATRSVRNNYGYVVNLEQAITPDLGAFARASWGAGRTEKIGWTDADSTFSFGGSLKGTSWGRPNDKVGLGGVVQSLSSDARAYFAAGGLGILIGDGQLNYRKEKVVEAFYAYSLDKWTTLTFDYQLIANPGYNADRGPVSVFTGRLHSEF